MRKNLKDIAEIVIQSSLRTEPVYWTSREITDRWGLDENQLLIVKQHAKKFAASLGVMWAWDPSIRRFRVAPADTAIARGMIEYAYEQWAKSGKSINHLIDGAAGQGFVSEHVRAKTRERNNIARAAIETAESKIRYRK